jgi:aspartyl-tRNA(Asn)/glutamyl-tRNA(Gln) amidotransferase subunit A
MTSPAAERDGEGQAASSPDTNTPLHYLTLDEAQRRIHDRSLSPVELTQAVLDRISTLDGELRAYIDVMADRALDDARAAEQEIGQGRWRGPLHGIPVAVKDQLDVDGAGARIRRATRAVGDATAVRKLRDAGAILLGKTHMSSLPEPTPPLPRNPWNTEHATGGSSTGSGAAVAGGLCLAALGEDTAGSIRQPAAYCGIVGFKATYGRVSRHGLAPLSWSLDQCGPMTRSVEDAAHVLQAIAGHDPRDPTSADAPVPDYAAALRAGVEGLRIGVPRDYIETCAPRTSPEVLQSVERAIDELRSLGAHVVDVSVPTMRVGTIANALIYHNEYWAATRKDAAWVLQHAAPQRRARIFLGLLTGSSDYIQAQRVRTRLRAELAAVFETVDCLALPAQNGPAPKVKDVGPLDVLYRHVVPEFQAPFNLAGVPALVLPCGFSADGLPIALQLAGKAFDEATVLRAGYAYQQATDWHRRHPPI